MKKVYTVLFIFYILVVLRLTVFRTATLSDYAWNVVPFVSLIKVYKTATRWQFLRLFLGNIGWFVPFGFLVPLCSKIKGWQVVLYGAFFSFLIELSQLIFKKGVAELDDLLLNTLGTALGYVLYLVLRKTVDKMKFSVS